MKDWLYTAGLLAIGCGGALPAGAEPLQALPQNVARILSAHGMPASSYSAWVQPVNATEPVLMVGADEPRNPASTIKLLTTFIALEELGPAYTWLTEAYLGGDLADGQLQGDLYLKGYGDPYMVTERLWLFLRQLRQRGIQNVRGDLVIDNSFFDLPPEDPGAFDGQTFRIYNVAPDAFLVNFKAISFEFRPDPIGGQVQIIADPQPANLRIRNQLRLIDGGCRGFQNGVNFAVGDDAGGPEIRFSGQYGSRCGESRLSRSVLSAPEYAYGVISNLWQEGGGTLDGGLRIEPVPAGLKPFAEFDSPPLSELIRAVNKWSNNVMTRQIFLTMGAERFGPPATTEKAREAITAALAERGLVFRELRLDNGAGLSRDTRISARNLARVLLAANQSPLRAEFVSSLALAGLDGTMRRRFRREPMAGRMHIKTGRLNGVFAMAGYVRTAKGEDYVVAAIQNHPDAHRGPGEEAHSELLRWVYGQ